MDFIERLLGISPDLGSGSLEWALLVSSAFGMVFVVFCRLRRKYGLWTQYSRGGTRPPAAATRARVSS